MRRAPACVVAILFAAAPALAQEEETSLPVTRVVLYASGVGYFEHEGTVEGDRVVTLNFDARQINDVLKSMVLVDLDGGQVRSVAYPSREPVERALSSFGVNLAGNPSVPELLNQLRGATITVVTTSTISGQVLNVTSETKIVGDPPAQVTEYTLNLVTDNGIASVPMSSVTRFELQDAQLRDELRKAMTLLAESRNTDRKQVDLRFEGEGNRRVKVGYLVETPVWKTAYRLDLGGASAGGEAEDGKAFLQGWAIVENTAENDWDDVTLSLVSGQPISFAMDLYTPLFVPRPTAQVPRFASLAPRIYDEGLGEVREELALQSEAEGRLAMRQHLGKAGNRGPAPAAAAPMMDMAAESRFGFDADAVSYFRQSGGVTAAAEGADLGELFRFTIQHPVDLGRRRSAMLPIVTQAVKAEKLSIYNQSVQAKHPLNGARLTNDTGLKLLGGPVTVFDGGAYAGDALIDHLGQDESRLLSYGIDLDVTVDPSGKHENRIVGAKIVRGVLQLSHRSVFEQNYKIDNGGKEEKVVLVEHPTQANRKLLEPAEFMEKTAELYRFRVPVPAGKTGNFKVREEQTHTQVFTILNFDLGALAGYIQNGQIDPKVRAALEQAAALKRELTTLERRRDEAQAELTGIQNGQARVRENLKVPGLDTDLRNRYNARLKADEDRIDELGAELDGLRSQIDDQRKKLEDYLAGLNIG